MSVDLGALVASPHFHWRTGMRCRLAGNPRSGTAVVLWVNWGTLHLAIDGMAEAMTWWGQAADFHPVIDPATLGCLAFDLLPEAWGLSMSVEVLIRPGRGARVRIYHPGGHLSETFESQDDAGDAVVAALLAAPPKVPS